MQRRSVDGRGRGLEFVARIAPHTVFQKSYRGPAQELVITTILTPRPRRAHLGHRGTALFQEEGRRELTKLDGTFTFALYDEIRRAVTILRWKPEDAEHFTLSLYSGHVRSQSTKSNGTPASPP